jgi:hypothetical protein
MKPISTAPATDQYGGVDRSPLPRSRFILRVAAESVTALVVLFLLWEFWLSWRDHEIDSQSNLYIALVIAALGVLGWFFPRVLGALFVIGGVLFGLAGLAFGGPEGVVFGVPPLTAGVLFLLSGRWRTAGDAIET